MRSLERWALDPCCRPIATSLAKLLSPIGKHCHLSANRGFDTASASPDLCPLRPVGWYKTHSQQGRLLMWVRSPKDCSTKWNYVLCSVLSWATSVTLFLDWANKIRSLLLLDGLQRVSQFLNYIIVNQQKGFMNKSTIVHYCTLELVF